MAKLAKSVYGTDGIPTHVTERLSDKHLALVIRQKVFAHLDDVMDPEEVCGAINADPIFVDMVSDLIDEWSNQRR